jgi:hypothetical protein
MRDGRPYLCACEREKWHHSKFWTGCMQYQHNLATHLLPAVSLLVKERNVNIQSFELVACILSTTYNSDAPSVPVKGNTHTVICLAISPGRGIIASQSGIDLGDTRCHNFCADTFDPCRCPP